ncbi:Clavaminate synthase-like protein [Amniculicola lignicola CBS 123094]|uniref:Clavaminate synthase-like protein n=1 Tax=Amniculicola lignicola CBS 123094 TaxID=1392246 RepID=A0A6A5W2J4_9PLEO|nr:Clavaminate synthase-like protein [Amniculicola lignicola CBS 123094]
MVSSIDSSSRPQATRIPIILKQIAPKSSITTAAQVGIENITLALTRGGAKGKGRRKPYSDSRVQKETNFTRLIKACVRCRMQRIRCNPDPNNPTGPCLSCQNVINTMSRLPCLRYKVTESVLHRTGLDYMAFYKAHPMVGPKFGDFYMAKDWTNAPTRFLDITQDRGTILQLEVREFRPPVEPGALDLKGRSMYAIPWAIADADVAVESINEFLDASVGPYLDHLLDDSNHLVWDVFHSALRLSLFPFPNELLRDVLRLWVGCRFIESRWRCCGTDNLDAEQLKDPFYEWISPPPYIDYQFASLVMHRVLGPLRRSILKGLQDLILANKAGNWYPIFLTVFILLYNYELSMVFQLQFALRRQAAVSQRPFRANFSWDSPENQRLADLDAEQSAFMKRIAGHVQCLAGILHKVYKHHFGKCSMAPGILLNDSFHSEEQSALRTKPIHSAASSKVLSWPTHFTSDLAWSAASFQDERDYTVYLTPEHTTEINSALKYFKQLEIDGSEINCESFPLPTLGPILKGGSLDLHNGRGFLNIRGLGLSSYSVEDNVLVSLGLSSYIGELRAKQDEDGSMLMHIRDVKETCEPQRSRPTRYSKRASTFHTDTFCDIVALQTRSCAAQGGKHMIASSLNIYNRLAATRPDLVELLARPDWSFDSRGPLLPACSRPLLFYQSGRIILNFAREPLVGLQDVSRAINVPRISSKQLEALDTIEAIANEHQLVLNLRPGDLTFINNHAVLHSREAFEDDATNQRYLIRFWLKNKELAWKLPRQLQYGNSRLYDAIDIEERWNIIHVPRLKFKLSERLSS